jgi:hypothetical protein
MRHAAALVAAFFLALPAAHAGSAGGAAPVLGRDWTTKTVRLFDPLTLKPVAGRVIAGGFFTGPWAWSSDRTRLALTRYDWPRLRIIDATKLRTVGDVTLGRVGVAGGVDAVTWVAPARLLAVVRGENRVSFVLVDAQKLSVLRTVSVSGAQYDVELTAGGLAVLLGPRAGIGPARIAVAGADGSVRTAALPGISVGSRRIGAGADPRVRSVIPGFAADPAGTIAVAVTAGNRAVAVNLRTLAVASHDLVERRVQRVQKSIEGPQRYARWVGGGYIAISGSDWSRGPGDKVSAQAAGVRLLDTRTWTTQMLDADASSFSFATGVVIAYGGSWGNGKSTYAGVHAYGLDGALRWSLYDRQDAYAPVLGQWAYVERHVGANRPLVIDVVDPSSGAVVNTRRWPNGQAAPTLYAGDGGSF